MMPALHTAGIQRPRLTKALEKLSLIGDRGQTDHLTTSTRAGLRRCRWPRPRYVACLTALACSWWR